MKRKFPSDAFEPAFDAELTRTVPFHERARRNVARNVRSASGTERAERFEVNAGNQASRCRRLVGEAQAAKLFDRCRECLDTAAHAVIRVFTGEWSPTSQNARGAWPITETDATCRRLSFFRAARSFEP